VNTLQERERLIVEKGRRRLLTVCLRKKAHTLKSGYRRFLFRGGINPGSQGNAQEEDTGLGKGGKGNEKGALVEKKTPKGGKSKDSKDVYRTSGTGGGRSHAEAVTKKGQPSGGRRSSKNNQKTGPPNEKKKGEGQPCGGSVTHGNRAA